LRDQFGSVLAHTDKTSDMVLDHKVQLHKQAHEFGGDLCRQVSAVMREVPVVDEPVSPRVRLAAAEAIYYSNQLLNGHQGERTEELVEELQGSGPPSPSPDDIRRAASEALQVSDFLLESSGCRVLQDTEENIQCSLDVASQFPASRNSELHVENDGESSSVSEHSSLSALDIDHAVAESSRLSRLVASADAGGTSTSHGRDWELGERVNAAIHASEQLLKVAMSNQFNRAGISDS